MVWAHPAAALALVAIAIPLLLHLFTKRTARSIQFPTLRFIQAERLASLKRRAFDDVLLLAIRAAIVAAAVLAAAGPLLVTSARRRAWDAHTTQRTIADARELPGAIAWLRAQPPASREIVIRSTFPLGSITDADVAAVPADIGLRFERTASLPASRVAAAPSVLAPAAGRSQSVEAIDREVILARDRTSVRDVGRSAATMPVEIVAPDEEHQAAAALFEAILRERIPAPATGRLARIELARPVGSGQLQAIRSPWMGDAAAHIIREARSHNATADIRAGWANGRLVIATSARAGDEGVRAVVRAVFDALAPAFVTDTETVPISDGELASWSRPPTAAPLPAAESIGAGDRRWLWLSALALLVVESIVRRARSGSRLDAEGVEASRVA